MNVVRNCVLWSYHLIYEICVFQVTHTVSMDSGGETVAVGLCIYRL